MGNELTMAECVMWVSMGQPGVNKGDTNSLVHDWATRRVFKSGRN